MNPFIPGYGRQAQFTDAFGDTGNGPLTPAELAAAGYGGSSDPSLWQADPMTGGATYAPVMAPPANPVANTDPGAVGAAAAMPARQGSFRDTYGSP